MTENENAAAGSLDPTPTGEWKYKESIQTDGCWLPSPQHCRVTRTLVSYSIALDDFIAHLQAAAVGLEKPSFTDYDFEEDEAWPGVCGFRLRTEEEHTCAEQMAIELRERELADLARLKVKYEVSDV